jgi:CRISPR system Cascade subunit CasE
VIDTETTSPDGLYFTRATLRTGSADLRPLLDTLLSGGEPSRDTTHRLLWTLMPEAMQAEGKPVGETGDRAAFLWARAPDRDGRPAWYVLGPAPRATAAFFDIDTKPWAPALAVGDRLGFSLSVHATVDRMHAPEQGRAGRHRVDVVMDAIHRAEQAGQTEARAALRRTAGAEALAEWWRSQGERNGFDADATELVDYGMEPLGRRRKGARGPTEIGVGQLTGTLTVTDPDAFARKLAIGFGRAKAFGHGLLLLRRLG